MGDYGKFKWVFRLLKSKEGRKVVLIPLIIMIVFSGYEIYQMEFNYNFPNGWTIGKPILSLL